MAVEREKMFECEVRRRRVKAGGGYEPYWKVKNVAVALVDEDTEFRCKDCFGQVKLLGRNGKAGTVAYVEHKLRRRRRVLPQRPALQEGHRRPRPQAPHPVE